MASKAEFYQTHLDRVSRSFAFCIRQLQSPLREWVGLSYLLCRVVDTVEDAPWASPPPQFEAFRRFDQALLHDPKVLEGWGTEFPEQVNESEKLLLADAARLMADYHQFPPPVREVMQELIHSMSQGMQHFCRGKQNGALHLRSLTEVNQYCFFVAGVVGELLTKLVAKVEPRLQLTPQLLLEAHHFGLFLQKVNLLKDQVGDEKVGRHLIPSRDEVERSSQENAEHALEFLLALPLEQSEFRRFCAWSLFLGLEALNVARRSLSENKVLKVARGRMEEILAKVEESLSDSARLRQLFQELIKPLGWTTRSPRGHVGRPHLIPDWFLKLYHGPLKAPRLSELGVAAP
ncbi:MAG: squalene/phytoene synthase family protein [Bdellovibrionales bacterium]|nr:squalene/phytoene synthase family protein [Bdellovibrionales bacterium]